MNRQTESANGQDLSYKHWHYSAHVSNTRGSFPLSAFTQFLPLTDRSRLHSWFALVTVLLLLVISWLAYVNRDVNQSIYNLSRYLLIFPVMSIAYLFEQRAAMWVAFMCTGLFMPSFVQQLNQVGFAGPTIELLALLVSYNLFALLVSTLVSFDRQQRRLVAAVDQLGQVIEKSLDVQELLPSILQESVGLCGADSGDIVLVMDKARQEAAAEHDPTQDQSGPFVAAADLDYKRTISWLLNCEEGINIANITLDPRFEFLPEVEWRQPALLVVPVSSASTQIGFLALWRDNGTAFSPAEIDLVHVLMAKSELAIENAWLYSKTDEALSQRARELNVLLDASTAFSSARDVDELLQALSLKMVEIAGASFCRVYLLNEQEDTLISRTSYALGGWDDDLPVDPVRPIQEMPWHWRTLERKSPVVLDHDEIGDEPDIFPPNSDLALLLPLLLKEKAIGVVVVTKKKSRPEETFTTEIELCHAIAQQAALALENIWAFDSIAQENAKTQLILENVTDGIIGVDLERRISAFNPAAERLTGYSAAEALGLHISDLVHCTDNGQRCLVCGVDCTLQEVALQKEIEAGKSCKAWLTRRDGQKLQVVHSAAPLTDAEQNVTGAVSVVRDISREEELTQLKSDFISLVSHQLRTPLTNISIAAELLSSADLNEWVRAEKLETIYQQSVRLKRLVEQVLDVSRFAQGQADLEPLILPLLINETVKIFRSQYSNHQIETTIPPDLPYVLADRVAVELIFENLIQNAIHHSGEGSRICVAAEARDSQVLVSVADNGAGIPPDRLETLFQPFLSRKSGTSVRKGRGFGLGLHLTKTAVEAQGGRIWVKSKPGQGTCFWFTLQQVEEGDVEDFDR